MIARMTNLVVADNSGAKLVRCIGIPGYSYKRYAYVGDIITVTVKEALPSSNIKVGTIHRAVVVRTAKEFRRKDGSYVKFDDNACVLLQPTGEPVGTRVFGPIPKEVREKGFAKIASLASMVV